MLEILGGLVVATALSGVIPLVNAELVVVGAAAALPAVGIPLVAAVSTIGQMSTKTTLFALARWAPSKLPARARQAVGRAGASLERRGQAVTSLVFASATTGLPPFYGVSLATGALGMPIGRFLVVGGLGRFLRFGALAWLGRGLVGG
jgi:membrane protein YqaA with SNARE-associated domain